MSNLIKMELYKLRTSKLFIILLIIFALTNALIVVGSSVLMDVVASQTGSESMKMNLSGEISSPFSLEMLLMFNYISVVSFLFLDFSDGYIKNIAGQLSDRGGIVTAKYIAVAVHNLIFFIVAALSGLAAGAIVGMNADVENIGAAIATLCIKWLLSLAINAILMFFAVGLRSKPFALIIGVMISLGAFSLLYLGIDTVLINLFKVENFTLNAYMPDTLMSSVSVGDQNLVANGIIVAVIFIALFFTLTYITFKKKDIK